MNPLNFVTLSTTFLIIASSSALAGMKFKKGDQVDAIQSGTYYKAKIIEANPACYGVLYDDGTQTTQSKADIAPLGSHTEGETKAESLKYEVGEAVDLLWNGGSWYRGKITSIAPCYKVEYIGWNGESETVGEDRLFPNNSKVKGDTSSAATASKNAAAAAAAGSFSSGSRLSEDQKQTCYTTRERNKCMRYGHCMWDNRDDRCKPNL